jgi:FKBP-type peptidyl-prolyl cis-trans isomerase
LIDGFQAPPKLGLRMQAITAQVGDVVGVHYKGTLDNGEVFDQNIGKL